MPQELVLAKPRMIELHERCFYLDTAAAVLVRLHSGTQELFFCRHYFLPQFKKLRIEGARFFTCMGDIIGQTCEAQVNQYSKHYV
ncbi:MAG: hypothetical protein NVSMB39_2460 [Candidatus Saccharimonadales bacterium]